MIVVFISYFHVDFGWGWGFKTSYRSRFSHPVRWRYDDGIAFVKPPFDNHIYHALEGLGFLWVKLLDPASLPPISTFLLSHYRHSDVNWITEINRIVFSLFPSNVSFVWDEDLWRSPNCYKHIVESCIKWHVDSVRSSEGEFRWRILVRVFVIRFVKSGNLSTTWFEDAREVIEDCSHFV